MRTTVFALIVLLAAIGYGYYLRHPEDRAKLLAQVNPFFQTLPPIASTSSAPATNSAATNHTVAPSSMNQQTALVPPIEAAAPAKPERKWIPPASIPAQPSWTWTTTSGVTYQNVVITSLDVGTVAITHSAGVARLPISTLPAAIQKQLNYDPELAAAHLASVEAEATREEKHPYYNMAALADAQAAARQLHWPLAWIDSSTAELSVANPPDGSEAALAQMAMSYLKTRAVIIFLDENTDLGTLSPVIRDQQLFQYDDVNVPPPHHFFTPKIVFSDPDITKPLGRVSYTQMKASGSDAIDKVLGSIPQQ